MVALSLLFSVNIQGSMIYYEMSLVNGKSLWISYEDKQWAMAPVNGHDAFERGEQWLGQKGSGGGLDWGENKEEGRIRDIRVYHNKLVYPYILRWMLKCLKHHD